METLRHIHLIDDWPKALAQLEAQLLQRSSRERVLDLLNGAVHSASEPRTVRMLAALVIGRGASDEARKLLWDVIVPDSNGIGVAAVYALLINASTHEQSENQRQDFWIGLLCGFDIGELIAPGFRVRVANRMQGLPPDAVAADRNDDGIPIPFEQYKVRQVEDFELEARIEHLIRMSTDGAVGRFLWQRLSPSQSRTLLAKEILLDVGRASGLRLDAAEALRKAEPDYLLFAAAIEQDNTFKPELLRMISQVPQPETVLELLKRALQSEPRSDRILLAMADGLSRMGNKEGVEYLAQVSGETQDSDLRTGVLRALAQSSRSAQADAIKESAIKRLLVHSDPSVRRQALDSLWQLRGQEASEAIRVVAANDASIDVRQAAEGLLNRARDKGR
jgi:hypothetical protein